MTINEHKAALKNIIDATNDEQLLRHWKTHLEREFEQHRQRAGQEQQTSSAEASSAKNTDKDDDEGYVVLESGLGIDE